MRSTMGVLLFLVFAMSLLCWSHALDDRHARVRQANRILTGKYERRWQRQGGNIGEIITAGLGNAVGQLGSSLFGTITGGTPVTRGARSGMANGGRVTGEYTGGKFGGKAGAFLGRQADKMTKAGRQAQAAEKNKQKEQAEALKKPVLHTGAGYKQAKLSRTGSSPGVLQRAK